jgi:Xaa-Pro aminopeptidase
MATLIVLSDRAALVAESIYWDQAETQLAGTGIEVVRHPLGSIGGTLDWLPKQLTRGMQVAVNGVAMALSFAQQLQGALETHGIALRPDLDLVSRIWADRPAPPDTPVFEHPIEYAITPRREKLDALRASMAETGATHHLVSSLEDVAWLTNLRGTDSPNTPVFLAHLLLDATSATLFVDRAKLSPSLTDILQRDGIALADYGAVCGRLGELTSTDTLLLDPRRCTLGLRNAAGVGCKVIERINPSTMRKSRKSAGEAENIRRAMAADGAAMCEFYAWFESALGNERVTEITVHERLTAARRKQPGFIMPSFPTIAGFNGHGALPHYVATEETDVAIEGDGLLLIDSGAQFLGATTDITRVWPIGSVPDAVKRDVTMVLKAHIALSSLRFPRGVLSPMLDAVARAPMWAEGMDYSHGTGHGVGYCLGVHEGPQTFRQAIPETTMAMEPGLVTSIEPALYRPGRWGARIENLVLTVPADTPEGETFGRFLQFETLTLCPIDTRCLEPSLLQQHEIAWLDTYHATVRTRLSPMVDGPALEWLLQRTQPLAASLQTAAA